ncbi:MAG: hypothetical protein RR630_06280, partial [Coprobacillus sp.]
LDIEDQPTQKIEVIEACGYGVWEKARDDLCLYYQDRHQYINTIHYKGLDIDDYFIEAYDNLHINKYIQDNIETLKIKYNIKYEKRKLFNQYLPLSYRICRNKVIKKYVFFY